MRGPRFAYVHARIQARHGERPGAASWRSLHAVEHGGRFLQRARQTSLSRWLAAVDEPLSPAAIDERLRRAYAEHVEEVARWVPPEWREATVFAARLSGGPLANRDPARLASEWRASWPRVGRGDRRALEALVELASAHVSALAEARDDTDGWAMRADLEGQLGRCLRRVRAGPAVVFIHLALTWLEVERLRGGLLRRADFAGVRSEARWV